MLDGVRTCIYISYEIRLLEESCLECIEYKLVMCDLILLFWKFV